MDINVLKEEIRELEELFEKELRARSGNIDNLLQQLAVRKARLCQLEGKLELLKNPTS